MFIILRLHVMCNCNVRLKSVVGADVLKYEFSYEIFKKNNSRLSELYKVLQESGYFHP